MRVLLAPAVASAIAVAAVAAAPVTAVPVAAVPVAAASVAADSAPGSAAGTGSLGPSVRTGPVDPDGSGIREYVALGDSYAAVGRVLPGRWTGGPPYCLRTDDAYPGVVADALRPARFVNATCAGGVVDHLWSRRDGLLPPQLDALGPETDLVTLSIGGNDVGLADVVLSCVLPPPLGAGGGSTSGSLRQAGAESVAGAAGSVLPPAATDHSAAGSTTWGQRDDPATATPTAPADTADTAATAATAATVPGLGLGPGDTVTDADTNTGDDDDETGVPGSLITGSLGAVGTAHDCRSLLEDEMPDRLDSLARELDSVHAEIRRRAPEAVVVATGYPALLPRDGVLCPVLDTIPRGLIPSIVAFERDLDRTVTEAATRNGALSASVSDVPGHDVCAPPSERWVDVLGVATGAGPLHPTRLGQARVAAAVLSALER